MTQYYYPSNPNTKYTRSEVFNNFIYQQSEHLIPQEISFESYLKMSLRFKTLFEEEVNEEPDLNEPSPEILNRIDSVYKETLKYLSFLTGKRNSELPFEEVFSIAESIAYKLKSLGISTNVPAI